MKTKQFICIILATVLAFSIIPLSASAAYYSPKQFGLDCQYLGSYGNINLSTVPFGTLIRVAVGNDLLETYQPAGYISNGSVDQILVEKYGLYTHILDSSKSINIGSWKIVYTAPVLLDDGLISYWFELFLNGQSVYKQQHVDSTDNLEEGTFRYGFIFLNINDTPYIWVVLKSVPQFKNINYQNNTNYGALSLTTDSDILKLPNFTMNGNDFLLKATAGGSSINTEVDLEGGNQTPATVFFDSWLTCSNCGSHNVSYKPSFLYTGAMVVTGQIGYVFKCRDCGASWKGIVSNPEENELFKQYMQEVEYSDNLVEDNTLPPFATTGGTVDLPSDVGGVADYIQQAFGALSSFTTAFNEFFSSVFAVLPAPVLAVIFLGIGLVIIVGIIKIVRG